ncbi:hypothetical protein N5C25_13375 [Stenotrophomonas sp. GD03958]|nr:hypothetical protein [Stenotrophomonas sp. GD03958]MDH1194698.1 hypothetical protein [Stenotrophomonas sp. GD03958]
MRRILILLATHLLTLGLGFGLGVYFLPILIAPDDPPAAQVQAAMKDATYRTTFRRDLKGSDAVHWAEGKVSVSATRSPSTARWDQVRITRSIWFAISSTTRPTS